MKGRAVDNILLDTECFRTLVHQEWVLIGRMLDGEPVAICCAHAGGSWYENHGGKSSGI